MLSLEKIGKTTTMARKNVIPFFMIMGLASLIASHVHGDNSHMGKFSGRSYHNQIQKLEMFKASFIRHDSVSPASSGVYHVTKYGADPTGKTDSTEAILAAISDAFNGPNNHGYLLEGILNLDGAQINLDGGNYLISRPLRFPAAGAGNLMVFGGTLTASDNFPDDGFLIELSPAPNNSAAYNYEFITFKNIMLDSNFHGGGISIINSLRTTIDNCYITHFTTNGILIQSGHETLIRNTFLGQHITAGADPGERNFTGTAINIMGNDNSVTDVVIFSAAIGILVSGQANTLSGVHCYNKATGFGGTGIYLKLPSLTQTRIVNCYMDFTGIVAEDPVGLVISDCFFLGDSYISLKSIKGVVNGISIEGNMFSGSEKGVDIVKLDETAVGFREIGQVIVDRNNVRGMKMRSTVGRGVGNGNGSLWVVDFNDVLLFRNLIKNVQFSPSLGGNLFPSFVVRDVSDNRVVIESNFNVSASLYVTVEQ